ncbi:carbon-nitrogen hydrolase family protein [Dietzia sp.]|uniref:carbon-nitrogen hydrolase family protein n=1 Tax=Dietzia sp. TaxID=1871616 RepID=UPI002FDA2B3F
MRIAAAQVLTGADPARNLDVIREKVREAAEQGARVVAFPEASMRAFGKGPLDEVAEELDGPWASVLAESAREHGVLVAAGMFRPSGDGRVFNTYLVTGPVGGGRNVHLGYDKIHLYNAFGFRESDTVAPGESTSVVEVDGLPIGFSVCYDIRFPGQFLSLAHDGARLTILGASWGSGPGKVEQWELLARARALDATTPLLAVGQADPASVGEEASGSAPRGVGHSLFVGADGAVLRSVGEAPELFCIDVDTEAVDDVRGKIPVLSGGRITE